MTTLNRQVRRATVEDVQKLGALWDAEGLPRKALEPRFKEFQMVESASGDLLGAIGFQIAGTEGCLHSEAFAQSDQADELRGLIWERAQLQAKNHGLVRIWTQLSSPFWHSTGIEYADEAMLSRLPGAFAGNPRPWHYLQLRDDLPPELSVDKEFALFRQQERAFTDRMLRQARVLKMVAGVISVVVFLLVLIWAIFFIKLKSGSGGQ